MSARRVPAVVMVDGKPWRVLDALSCGPGCVPHTYELAGGAYVFEVAGVWQLVLPRPRGPQGPVSVEVSAGA